MVGVLEGVGTHTQHETTRNQTQPRRFPTPTAEQGSNERHKWHMCHFLRHDSRSGCLLIQLLKYQISIRDCKWALSFGRKLELFS